MPIGLFYDHDIANVMLQSPLLLLVASGQPILRAPRKSLRWWVRYPLGIAVALGLMISHSYMIFDVLGFEKEASSMGCWFFVIIYFIGGMGAIQWWLFANED
ncbi:hypothetical protein R5M92_04220 [Halomonas sp. Bachu 37]|uniref:hypothetical protein n=1 Tax=Halomonas kashgarensis TaxID=3084920 RepID=UPI003216817B